MTNFLFAHQVDVLADETKAAVRRLNSRQLLKGVHLNRHFPWIPDLLESLPRIISKPVMPSGLLDMLDLFNVGYSLQSISVLSPILEATEKLELLPARPRRTDYYHKREGESDRKDQRHKGICV